MFIFHFSVFLSNRKNEKMEHICGYFLFFDFSAFNQKRKNRKLASSPLKFLFFYVWQKMEKAQLCQFFCYVFHILANWRDVMDLVRPHSYGLGHPRQPSPRVTLAEVSFSLFLCKINQPFTSGSRTPVSGGETTRVSELSHLGR